MKPADQPVTSKSVVKRLQAQGADQPTPADEEVARAPNDLIAWKWAQTLSEDEKRVLLSGNIKQLQTMITAALTEARRAGTPTTDAHAEYGSALVAARAMLIVCVNEVRRLRDEWALGNSQSKAVTADEIATKLEELDASALSSTPNDAIIAELKRVEPGAANYDAVPLEERVRRVVNRLINATTPSDEVAQKTLNQNLSYILRSQNGDVRN